MHDLGIDLDRIQELFARSDRESVQCWVVSNIDELLDELLIGLRRCYIKDEQIRAAVARHGRAAADVIAAVLPDRGNIQSGDFGEILAALFLASQADGAVLDPKKWRLKQRRNGAAPFADVVQFSVPEWPRASERDSITCAEVKAKATSGGHAPILAALEGSRDDRDGRLVKTLVWLKERALAEDLGSVTLELLDRFIKGDEHPASGRSFLGVAVVCTSLVEDELEDDVELEDGLELLVLEVPGLLGAYRSAYDGVSADGVGSVT